MDAGETHISSVESTRGGATACLSKAWAYPLRGMPHECLHPAIGSQFRQGENPNVHPMLSRLGPVRPSPFGRGGRVAYPGKHRAAAERQGVMMTCIGTGFENDGRPSLSQSRPSPAFRTASPSPSPHRRRRDTPAPQAICEHHCTRPRSILSCSSCSGFGHSPNPLRTK